ncbi:hypothetical protein MUN78_07095 [Leucobacter allii]|uniref:Ribbon-helix-helix protein CopG domain-containing protein n=1 Tax=Leucobacter allii TaxID=2932247 RepID=A0ABY4FQM0_9MICO|nr:hypothetical protein [Leucobacter allii]UOQ58583.1 hypothetical protein MUN78_07095 [Leucobacter allii]
MSNNVITVTLTPKTRERLLEQATAKSRSLERHAGELLAQRAERPEWSDVSEMAALAAEVDVRVDERDRARASAIMHSAAADALHALVRDAIASGRLVASSSFLADFERLAVESGRTS